MEPHHELEEQQEPNTEFKQVFPFPHTPSADVLRVPWVGDGAGGGGVGGDGGGVGDPNPH